MWSREANYNQLDSENYKEAAERVLKKILKNIENLPERKQYGILIMKRAPIKLLKILKNLKNIEMPD